MSIACPTCGEDPGVVGEPCLNGRRDLWHDEAERMLADEQTFLTELTKAGFTIEQRTTAIGAAALLFRHWSPRAAAEVLAIVVNTVGAGPAQILGAAMAAVHLADYEAHHPRSRP